MRKYILCTLVMMAAVGAGNAWACRGPDLNNFVLFPVLDPAMLEQPAVATVKITKFINTTELKAEIVHAIKGTQEGATVRIVSSGSTYDQEFSPSLMKPNQLYFIAGTLVRDADNALILSEGVRGDKLSQTMFEGFYLMRDQK